MNAPPPGRSADWHLRWQQFSSAALRAFHAYASWLVGISWRRFIVLALLLVIVVGIVHDKPPFTWTITEQVDNPAPRVVIVPPQPPQPPQASPAPGAPQPAKPPIQIVTPGKGEGVEISIGKDGIFIGPKGAQAAGAGASEAASAAQAAPSGAASGVHITLPPGATSEAVRAAVEEAKQQIADSIQQAREQAEQARQDAVQARQDAVQAQQDAAATIKALGRDGGRTRRVRVGIGDAMMQLALLWIAASAIIKYTYKGRMQAEVKAAQATETAEAESLKRQVVEARMAAMQAQVEPHFLFNTLASIDYLIQTDPARASVMQKNLIALLRASMPTMREASDGGVRDLGRELAVIRPYVEILKVRMEERLQAEIAVPDGLLSAEFPPMMIQTLVENAIKHGLEPKPEGGSLRVAAEIVHGKLQVTVADTGLGFGKAPTAGTGVGLANIRERLQLLYGPRATLTVAANQPSGTVVTITVPYKTIEGTPT
ncbi:MAG: histidine kinase [Burkholderiales bacterium]|nr:histidine kinase [Burkholderiales bacterium]MDE1929107.1 histidine kinase [Burkholderiales bacterium]MDE2159933.1 histidine kinase [Burkholderiales bacterium]MDE2503614.1 histidine kinase [Burkholderiales bacterium]